MTEKKFEFTAVQLKWIAVITMFINHLAACLNRHAGLNGWFFGGGHWYLTRISFVIFAYQIAEGMHYTKNRKKYIISLFIFALVSEIPYDLFNYSKLFYFADQNVIWNFVLGALAIDAIDRLNKKPLYSILITIAAMIAAVFIHACYLTMAEAIIVCFYYFRDDKKKQLLYSAIAFTISNLVNYVISFLPFLNPIQALSSSVYWYYAFIEMHGLLAWPIFMLYNGAKGKNISKWFFYAFYPGHLLLLYILGVALTK